MRNVRALTILVLVTIVTMMIVVGFGCTDNSKPKEPANNQVTEQTPPVTETPPAEVAMAYACPMHPEQASNDPEGICPLCGMKFQPTAKTEEVAQTYACPMHPDQKSTDINAVCPICGMKLEPVKETEEAEAQVYACTVHPDQTSIDPNAVCPICGAKLEPVKDTEDADKGETGEAESGETEPGGSETETGK